MYKPHKCPYCRFEMQPLEEAVICKECGTIQHKDCWVANLRRCATPNCDGAVVEWQPARPSSDSRVTAASSRHSASSGSVQKQGIRPATVLLSLLLLLAVFQAALLNGGASALFLSSPNNVRVFTERIAVHSTTSMNSPVVAEISQGAVVSLIAVTPTCAKVKLSNGKVGFVPRDRLDLLRRLPKSSS